MSTVTTVEQISADINTLTIEVVNSISTNILSDLQYDGDADTDDEDNTEEDAVTEKDANNKEYNDTEEDNKCVNVADIADIADDYVFIPLQEQDSHQDPLVSCCNQLEDIDRYNLKEYNYTNLIIGHAKYILSTNPNTEELTGTRRIFHILNTFLRNFEIDTINKKNQFIDIITSITYCAPWDEENVIFYQLDKLCTFLLIHYPNNDTIEKIITEDITQLTILNEIDEILKL